MKEPQEANPPLSKRERDQAYWIANREKRLAQKTEYYAKNRKWRRERNRAYSASISGAATRLRGHHGFDKPTSEYWAAILTNPKTRCAICGLPLHKLLRMLSWKHGGQRMNRRMTLDHINPGVNDGQYRPLCCSCNVTRGDAHFTDAEVLEKMRDWYIWRYAIRKLWWLNTHIEDGKCVGGREERTPRMAAKIADLEEGDDERIESTG